MQWLGDSVDKEVKLDLCLIAVEGEVETLTPATASGRSGDLAGVPPTMEFLLQPINRTLLEEVNENNGTMEPVRFPVAAPADIPAPAPAGSSADGQIYRPEAAGRDKPQGSEHSIEQLDPKTPGWTQRGSQSLRILVRAGVNAQPSSDY